MPGPPPTAQHGSGSRYRYGCRCAECRAAHTEESAHWRYERDFGTGAPRGPEWRREVLRSLKTTGSVITTAKTLGVTHQAIYGAALAVPEFGEQLEKLTAPRD